MKYSFSSFCGNHKSHPISSFTDVLHNKLVTRVVTRILKHIKIRNYYFLCIASTFFVILSWVFPSLPYFLLSIPPLFLFLLSLSFFPFFSLFSYQYQSMSERVNYIYSAVTAIWGNITFAYDSLTCYQSNEVKGPMACQNECFRTHL